MRKILAMLLGSALVAATMVPADAAPRRGFRGGHFGHAGGLGFHRGGLGFHRGGLGFHRGGRGFGARGFHRFGRLGGPRFRGGYGYGYRHRGYGYRHYGFGPAIGAGVAGLATGALIGGALASQSVDPGYAVAPAGNATAYCERRFKSYDAASGTYLGYDGVRHPCP